MPQKESSPLGDEISKASKFRRDLVPQSSSPRLLRGTRRMFCVLSVQSVRETRSRKGRHFTFVGGTGESHQYYPVSSVTTATHTAPDP